MAMRPDIREWYAMRSMPCWGAAGCIFLLALASPVPFSFAETPLEHFESETKSAANGIVFSYIVDGEESFGEIRKAVPEYPYVFVVNATTLEVIADETPAGMPGTIMAELAGGQSPDELRKSLLTGGIWVEHEAVNPATGITEPRRSYLTFYDGYIFGAGYYIAETEERAQLLHLQTSMLDMINTERTAAGLDAVTLGDNAAAQDHAEAMMADCFSGHWGLDGLKAYMRYSLAGGYQYNSENISGYDYCVQVGVPWLSRSVDDALQGAMDGLMDSPGHRATILDPHHARVNLGFAWDGYHLWVVQQFEYGYAMLDQLPTIQDDTLTFSGTALGDVYLKFNDDLGVSVDYDPPPHALTLGQVARTYCLEGGIGIASILRPLPPDYYYVNTSYDYDHYTCPDPYDVPPTAPPPASGAESTALLQEAYDASQNAQPESITVPYLVADEWSVSRNSFEVSADIGSLLDKWGPGVYTIVLYGAMGEDYVPMTMYSILYDIPMTVLP